MGSLMRGRSYVLITAARDEEIHIERLIRCVIGQSILPQKWVIVSDGSRDRTDEIVRSYSVGHRFIEPVRIAHDGPRSFGGQACALNSGCEYLRDMSFEFVGFLDADISFGSDYIEGLLRKFSENPRLGLCGGSIFEKRRGAFRNRYGNRRNLVAGATLLFRRECYEGIGAYIPMKYGGYDWIANVMTRMNGWDVKSFPEFQVMHFRKTGALASGLLRRKFRAGVSEYMLGYNPLFQMAKCVGRLFEGPYVLGSMLRAAGYYWAWLKKEERPVSVEFLRYVRDEQIQRMKSLFRIVTGTGWMEKR